MARGHCGKLFAFNFAWELINKSTTRFRYFAPKNALNSGIPGVKADNFAKSGKRKSVSNNSFEKML